MLYAFVLGCRYLCLCFISWYLLTRLHYSESNRLEWRRPMSAFQRFVKELQCYLPGGREYRIAFIRDRTRYWGVDADDAMFSLGKGHFISYREIEEKGLHEEVFYAIRGGHFHFWASQALDFFAGPVVILVYLLVFSFVVLVNTTSRPKGLAEWK